MNKSCPIVLVRFNDHISWMPENPKHMKKILAKQRRRNVMVESAVGYYGGTRDKHGVRVLVLSQMNSQDAPSMWILANQIVSIAVLREEAKQTAKE